MAELKATKKAADDNLKDLHKFAKSLESSKK